MQPWSQPLLWPAPGGAVACDPYFGNVVLLMGYEGVNGSTGAPGMTDESPAAHGIASVSGTPPPQISTAQFKFGSSSLTIDGAHGRFNYADSNDWNLGSSPFTVECWLYTTTITGTHFIVGQWNVAGDLGWIFSLGSAALGLSISTTGSDNIAQLSSSINISANTWYHAAIDFDGTKYRLYVNGVMGASNTTLRTIHDSPDQLSVGMNQVGSAFWWNGYIDELRITKGVARYASDAGFAVPTAAFPRVQC
jgi:hypothetical protein